MSLEAADFGQTPAQRIDNTNLDFRSGSFNDSVNGSSRAVADLNFGREWLPKNMQEVFPTLPDKRTIEPVGQVPLDGSWLGNPLELAPPSVKHTYRKVPVLRLGETADEKSTELLEVNSPMARMYADHKNSIVKISYPIGNNKEAVGTGFFVSEDGRIATAKHVIDDAQEFTVTTADGRQFKAKPVSGRETSDVAAIQLIKTDPDEKFQALKLADTAQNLQHGEPVYALGHPHGWDKVYISPGTVNDIDTGTTESTNPNRSTLKAFVHVEHGNSGGPLLNAKGEVVGLARSILETDNQTILSWLQTEDKLSTSFNTVDDLKAILPENSTSHTASDYLVPKKLDYGPKTILWGGLTAFRAHGALSDWRGAGNRSFLGGVVMPVFGGMDLYARDVPYMQAAFKSGTLAEKIDSSLNVTADAMIMSRAIGLFSPRARALTGALQIGGAAFKLADSLLARRAYD